MKSLTYKQIYFKKVICYSKPSEKSGILRKNTIGHNKPLFAQCEALDTLCLYNLLKVKLGSWPSHDGITEWRMPSFQLSVSYLDSVHMCAVVFVELVSLWLVDSNVNTLRRFQMSTKDGAVWA